MRLHLSGLITAAVLALPGLARAAEETHPYVECTHEASDADVTAAKAAFQAGNVSFNEADYPRAILYWEDAFRRDCSAKPLLLNLARAYELNGQKQQAVIALETFLAREPNSTETAQIQRRIEVLKKQIDAEAAAAPAVAPAPQPPAPPPPKPDSAPPPPAAPEQSKPNRVVPLVVAGTGLAMFVAGGIVYLHGAGKVKDYEKQCGTSHKECPPAVVDPANSAARQQTAGGVVALVGLPVLAGGVIWYFAAGPSSSKSAAHVTPAVGPGFAGLALDGRF
jgi:hypothetical protein